MVQLQQLLNHGCVMAHFSRACDGPMMRFCPKAIDGAVRQTPNCQLRAIWTNWHRAVLDALQEIASKMYLSLLYVIHLIECFFAVAILLQLMVRAF